MKTRKLLTTIVTAIVLVSCSTPTTIMKFQDGIYRAVSNDSKESDALYKANKDAKKYCLNEYDSMPVIISHSSQYVNQDGEDSYTVTMKFYCKK
jgi:uncharacterized lipoprotein YajG